MKLNLYFTAVSVLFLHFVFPTISQACTCTGDPPFCETVFNGNGEIWADLIVLGEKVGDYDSGMNVRVIQVLHGESDAETIRVRSGNGADCGVFTGIFKKGDVLVMALNLFTFNEPVQPTYSLSICGTTYLSVEDGDIVGRITNSINRIPISKFNSIKGCSGIAISPFAPDFKVFPNPAGDRFFLQPQDSITGELQLNLFDALGRKVRTWRAEAEGLAPLPFPLDGLPAGLYWLQVNALGNRKTVKIIIFDCD
jgi:hypothetical protein